MSDEKVMNIPIHHVHDDGSVSELHLVRYEGRDWMALRGQSDSSVVVGSAEHARAIARSLLIAANLMEKELGAALPV